MPQESAQVIRIQDLLTQSLDLVEVEVEVFILMVILIPIKVILMPIKVTLIHIRVMVMHLQAQDIMDNRIPRLIMVMHIQNQDIMDNQIPRPMQEIPMDRMLHMGLEEDSGVAVVEVVGSVVGDGNNQ